MNKKLLVQYCSIALFTFLFYKSSIGINLVIFELISIILVFSFGKFSRSKHLYITLIATIISLVSVLWHSSVLAKTMNYVSFFFFISYTVYPFKSALNTIFLSVRNLVFSVVNFIEELLRNRMRKEKKRNKRWRSLQYFILPVVFILIFIQLYSAASPDFKFLSNKFFSTISNLFDMIPPINWTMVGVIILGAFFSSYIYFSKEDKDLIQRDQNIIDHLKRERRHRTNKPYQLIYEHRTGLFLFSLLNILLAIVILTDIWNVWINFNWSGQFLKQFVHNGTYTLIFSILLSIALVLYYFRGNLNFFSKNKRLKLLVNVWVVQNALLALTVAIRNLRYIEHFNLAYKRIGVLFFLAATIYGLYTVYIKVNQKKSGSFLIRRNVFSVYLVMTIMSLFHWDAIIVKYNLRHADHAFLHLDYLSSMPDNCLYLLDKPLSFYEDKELIQTQKFKYRKNYMQPQDFIQHIERRKDDFLAKYPDRNWKGWNYADSKSFRELNRIKSMANYVN